MVSRRFTTGFKEIDKNLKYLKDTGTRRVVSAGMRKQGQYLAKQIKADVPSRYKSIRKAIGWRSLALRRNKGMPGVKVGAGVGQNKAAKGRANIVRFARSRGKRLGVGIDSRNIHWWFLGTAKRTTGTRRRGRSGIRVDTGKPKMNRGVMPSQMSPVIYYARREKTALMAIMRAESAKALDKELKKLKKVG
jgi:hypothetical protein